MVTLIDIRIDTNWYCYILGKANFKYNLCNYFNHFLCNTKLTFDQRKFMETSILSVWRSESINIIIQLKDHISKTTKRWIPICFMIYYKPYRAVSSTHLRNCLTKSLTSFPGYRFHSVCFDLTPLTFSLFSLNASSKNMWA